MSKISNLCECITFNFCVSNNIFITKEVVSYCSLALFISHICKCTCSISCIISQIDVWKSMSIEPRTSSNWVMSCLCCINWAIRFKCVEVRINVNFCWNCINLNFCKCISTKCWIINCRRWIEVSNIININNLISWIFTNNTINCCIFNSKICVSYCVNWITSTRSKVNKIICECEISHSEWIIFIHSSECHTLIKDWCFSDVDIFNEQSSIITKQMTCKLCFRVSILASSIQDVVWITIDIWIIVISVKTNVEFKSNRRIQIIISIFVKSIEVTFKSEWNIRFSNSFNFNITINTINQESDITGIFIIFKWDKVFIVECEHKVWNIILIIISQIIRIWIWNCCNCFVWIIDVREYISVFITNTKWIDWISWNNNLTFTIFNCECVNNITTVRSNYIFIDMWWINIVLFHAISIINCCTWTEFWFIEVIWTTTNIRIEEDIILNVCECCCELHWIILVTCVSKHNVAIIIIISFGVMTEIQNVVHSIEWKFVSLVNIVCNVSCCWTNNHICINFKCIISIICEWSNSHTSRCFNCEVSEINFIICCCINTITDVVICWNWTRCICKCKSAHIWISIMQIVSEFIKCLIFGIDWWIEHNELCVSIEHSSCLWRYSCLRSKNIFCCRSSFNISLNSRICRRCWVINWIVNIFINTCCWIIIVKSLNIKC